MKREGSRWLWTEDDDAYIIAHYSTATIRNIAAHFDVRAQVVQFHIEQLIKAGKLDRRARFYSPRWERWEIDYLKENYGQVKDRTICRKLKRSLMGVEIKAKRLGLLKSDNILSLNNIALILGVDSHKVRQWVYEGKLMARQGPWRKGKSQIWIVEFEALEGFIKNNPNDYDPQRIDQERYPMWYKLAMKHGFPDEPVLFPRAFEQWEIDYIIQHYPRQSPIEIAPALRRSVEKVRAKIHDLRVEGLITGYRPYENRLPNKWTEWEDMFLAAHHKAKMPYREIAVVLDRGVKACGARVRALIRKGQYERLVALWDAQTGVAA